LGSQTSYAFPFAVTNAMSHVVYTKYDYYLGRAVSTEDPNGVSSKIYYNDLLDRPTQVIRAANQDPTVKGQSTFAYDDANHLITTKSDQNNFADNTLQSQTAYDGLGRTTRAFVYDGTASTPWIATDTYFDALGHVSQVSNPYRVAAPSTTLPMT